MRREQSVKAKIGKLFKTAVTHLGEIEAQSEWEAAARRKSGPKGARNPDMDNMLLAIVDYVRKLGTVPESQIPRFLGKRLDGSHKGKFGNGANAIEKKVRRLLNARSKGSTVDVPTTLLGGAGQNSSED